MKRYVGNAKQQQVVVTGDGNDRALDRVRTVRMGRPGGLHAWGYAGGGPHDLAFDLLLDVSGSLELAQKHHGEYCDQFVARLPQDEDFTITEDSIRAWLRAKGNEGAEHGERLDLDPLETLEELRRHLGTVRAELAEQAAQLKTASEENPDPESVERLNRTYESILMVDQQLNLAGTTVQLHRGLRAISEELTKLDDRLTAVEAKLA